MLIRGNETQNENTIKIPLMKFLLSLHKKMSNLYRLVQRKIRIEGITITDLSSTSKNFWNWYNLNYFKHGAKTTDAFSGIKWNHDELIFFLLKWALLAILT